ncbi:MAG: hypothetical protein PVJ45_03325 [Desulfobacterales bacterium]|jgi:hypothetical protein
MEENNNSVASKITEKRFGCLQVFGLMVIAVIITAGVTILVFKTYFFPSEFKPVTLNPAEEKVLASKLENFDSMGAGVPSQKNHDSSNSSKSDRFDANPSLEPEPYREKDIKREIGFTERELNGLLAKNTDLAKKLAIDLSDDLISAKLLLPVDEDFPILGGKILRLRSGITFTYNKGKPVVILKGVTIMGVPIPNAWLGGIKNIDLVEKFGAEKGFWKIFSDGVEDIKIEEGLLKIKLKE